MQRRTFIASLASVVALPELATADCMPHELEARYVTRARAEIPPDGGVLVALATTEGRTAGGDPFAGDWSLVAGARRTRLAVTQLGPGLRRLTLPRGASGLVTIDGPCGTLEVICGGGPVPLLEQPALRGVYLLAPTPITDTASASATLVRPVPTGAVAALLRRHVGRGTVPTLLGRATPGTLYVGFNELPRCTPPIPGALVPTIGARVDVVFVDAFGRLSPPSGVVAFDAR